MYTRTCAGVDAFTHAWVGEVAYCAPPIALTWQVIQKIKVSSMSGILIIPLWCGAKFWLSAFSDGRLLAGSSSQSER
jgi:hypothetical protein